MADYRELKSHAAEMELVVHEGSAYCGIKESKIRSILFDRVNRAALRFFALGFNPTREELRWNPNGTLGVMFSWQCMCQRTESFYQELRPQELTFIRQGHSPNVYVMVESTGATTEKHLIDDGFPPEVIADILERGRKFDQMWVSMTGRAYSEQSARILSELMPGEASWPGRRLR